MLPIPGTANPDHLRENVAAASIQLSPADMAVLSAEGASGREPPP